MVTNYFTQGIVVDTTKTVTVCASCCSEEEGPVVYTTSQAYDESDPERFADEAECSIITACDATEYAADSCAFSTVEVSIGTIRVDVKQGSILQGKSV